MHRVFLFYSNIPFFIFLSLCNVSWYYFSSVLTYLQMFTLALRRQGRNLDFSETDRHATTQTQPQILHHRIFYLNVFMFYLCLLSFLVLFVTCHESVVSQS